jgi:hypothetical protein
MINESNFKSAGSALTGMLHGLGFQDQVGILYGASLDAAIRNNAGTARSLLDAYEPLAMGAHLEGVLKSMSVAAFVPSPQAHFPASKGMVPGFLPTDAAAFPSPAQMGQLINALLNRLNPQNFVPVLNGLNSGIPMSSNQSIPEAVGKTFEQIIASLEAKIEKKMDAEAQVPVKKKKKKGGLRKLKKSLKRNLKPLAKFANKTLKSVTHLQKSLSSFLKPLQTGNFLEFGRALTGGLIGGPVGGFLLDHLMKLGGKKNPLQQVFKQFHNTFDLVAKMQKNQSDMQQRSVFNKFLR